MGDGSLHAKGIRLCVADTDLDVVERLRVLSKELFEPRADGRARQQGYQEVILSSDPAGPVVAGCRLREGPARMPTTSGKGWTPRIPSAILETNDAEVYAGFLRGLFEADGTVLEGVPSVSTASRVLRRRSADVAAGRSGLRPRRGERSAAAAVRSSRCGCATSTTHSRSTSSIGFIGESQERSAASRWSSPQVGNRDRIHLPRAVWDEIVPVGHYRCERVVQSLRRVAAVSAADGGAAARESPATRGWRTRSATCSSESLRNEDGGVQPTYDLSVPDNVTYVAGGFVSHNTIGFMMDCDTTGIEPDFSLVKFKKLVGGGSMQIVNQTIPRALRKLGYAEETDRGDRGVHRRARARHRRARVCGRSTTRSSTPRWASGRSRRWATCG